MINLREIPFICDKCGKEESVKIEFEMISDVKTYQAECCINTGTILIKGQMIIDDHWLCDDCCNVIKMEDMCEDSGYKNLKDKFSYGDI